MVSIAENLQRVHARLRDACECAARPVADVRLLAVSKTCPAPLLRAAHAAGQHAFGENYVQEALEKMDALADLRPQLEWHFIGPLQSNKTRLVAERFDWVHSVDRLKLAERLSAQRPAGLPPLHVCVQVNISQEASKSGVDLADLPALLARVAQLPGLRLRGLMAIPEPADTLAAQRLPHARLRAALQAANAAWPADGPPALDTLSMGMSADLEAAVLEGATLVRVGQALFGARPAARAGA